MPASGHITAAYNVIYVLYIQYIVIGTAQHQNNTALAHADLNVLYVLINLKHMQTCTYVCQPYADRQSMATKGKETNTLRHVVEDLKVTR